MSANLVIYRKTMIFTVPISRGTDRKSLFLIFSAKTLVFVCCLSLRSPSVSVCVRRWCGNVVMCVVCCVVCVVCVVCWWARE